MIRPENKKGAALIYVFVVFVGLTSLALAFLIMINYEIISAGTGLLNMQAFNIAEAGRAKARWVLTAGGETVPWSETDISLGEGTYSVTAADDNGDGTVTTITSDGYIPDDTNPKARRRVIERDIDITAELTNLSLTADAAASSTAPGGDFDADNAIDGDSNTRWRSNTKNGSSLTLNFGGQTTFDRIVYISNGITSYSIQYSNDDVAYSAVTNPAEDPAGTVNFDSVSAQYLRFNVNGNKPSVYELETYNSAEGATTTLGQGKFVTSW